MLWPPVLFPEVPLIATVLEADTIAPFAGEVMTGAGAGGV
jgi:hypothetical protein